MSQNYLNEADTDDEDEKCHSSSSPEEVAEAQLKSLSLKGATSLFGFTNQPKHVLRSQKIWLALH